MANPTTNYGWPMPTSTDLVTDLPADFAAFGQPVDTTLKALNPETTLGDISYRSATSNTNTRLGIGTNGQVLAVSGGVPAWTTTSDVTPLTTKGDLFTFDTADARLAVGTNGQTLVADSSTSTGLKWAAPSSGAVTLITSGTISSAANSGTTFDGVFTSTYVNYLVLLSGLSHSAGAVNLLLQYRSAGPTTKTNEYYGGKQNLVAAGSVNNEYYNGGASTGVILSYLHTSASSNAKLHITGVGNSSQRALAHGTGFSGQGSAAFNTGFQCADADTYTGFILSVASGTFSGTIKVYGVSN